MDNYTPIFLFMVFNKRALRFTLHIKTLLLEIISVCRSVCPKHCAILKQTLKKTGPKSTDYGVTFRLSGFRDAGESWTVTGRVWI